MKTVRKWVILPTALALFVLDSHAVDSLARSSGSVLAVIQDTAKLLLKRSPG